MEIWRFGDLEILRFGDLEIWRFGDLEIWRFGDLEIWRFGDLEIKAPQVLNKQPSEKMPRRGKRSVVRYVVKLLLLRRSKTYCLGLKIDY